MKIKVLTLKDVTKYLVKFALIIIIIVSFTKFFYGKKNIPSIFSFDSSRFIAILKKEILVLKDTDIKNVYSSTEKYYKNTIKNEINVLKLATTKSKEVNSDYTENEELVENNISNEPDETKIEEDVSVELIPSSIPDKSTCELYGVQLRSECDYNLENEITDLNASFNKNDILIFHTHTCESYTPTEQNQYESTGNFRTTDLNYSVVRVGDELEKYLSNYGYNVVHDKSYHDYPAYNGSYNRSLITVKKLLEKYTNTDVVIDLHRDAIGDNTYAPKVKIGDDYCARLMFVIGTDGGGLQHDNWRNNLKFAIKVVQKANELYPGLFKPIIVRNSRYNHHLANAACIIEVGATGNTLEECLNSMKYLANIYNEIQ